LLPGFSVMADLEEKFPRLRELQDVGIHRAVAADPDVVLVIDEHAVLVVGPFVARRRPSPPLNKVACHVEFEDWRRRNTAIRLRRVESGVLIVVVESSGAAVHPNVIVRIDKDTANLAEHPIVGQRLRPEWIRLELRDALRDCREGEDEESDAGENV